MKLSIGLTHLEHMTHYQSISRKFRPQTFKEVRGQQAVVTTLKNAIKMDRVSHAYLFTGCRGTGKTTLARLFAKLLNCESPTAEFEPCNTCTSCKGITSCHSLDVIEIDGASNRGIDDIRGINETIGYATFSGKYKIYIIDEVHMLTKEAFNALLKTLEEPPEKAIFFFATTEPHKILPTILSRTQRFDLNRMTGSDTVEKLSQIVEANGSAVEEAVLKLIARLADGSMRDAESLLDQLLCYESSPITIDKASRILGVYSKSLFFSVDRAYKNEDYTLVFEIAKEAYQEGKDMRHFLESLLDHYRTVLLTYVCPRHEIFEHLSSEEIDAYKQSHQTYSKSKALYLIDYISSLLFNPSKIPFQRLHIESTLLHIVQSGTGATLGEIASDLRELQMLSVTPSLSSPTQEFQASVAPKQTPDQPPADQLAVESKELKSAPAIENRQPQTKGKQEILPPEMTVDEKSGTTAPRGQLPTSTPTAVKTKPTIEQGLQMENLVRFAAVEFGGRLKIHKRGL